MSQTTQPANFSTPQPTVARPMTAEESTQRPFTGNANDPDTINTVPNSTTEPRPTTAVHTQQPVTTDESVGLNNKLNAVDRYWKFKGVMQVILILTGIIGIGIVAWLLATQNPDGNGYGFDGSWTIWPPLVTFIASIIWCATCLIVLVARKKPVHPGLAVAMHLILWLAFIPTAMMGMVSLIEVASFGSGGRIDLWGWYSRSNDGDYRLAQNGTWVWEEDTSYVTSPRSCNSSSSSYSYYYNFDFKDCAEQDAFVNRLWQKKPTRLGSMATSEAFQWLGLLLHFVLFVWACIQTHRYNRSKTNKDAEKIAAGIVQTMITNGAIVPPPGQAHMRPTQGGMYYQLPQAYPLQPMQGQVVPGQQQQQFVYAQYPTAAPQGIGPTPGPSNEKGHGPRYA